MDLLYSTEDVTVEDVLVQGHSNILNKNINATCNNFLDCCNNSPPVGHFGHEAGWTFCQIL